LKKTSLILAISASFIVGTLVAGNLVFAAPADSQNELLSAILQEVQALTGLVEDSGPETIPLQHVAGRNVDLAITTSQTSLLFHGPELCSIRMRIIGSSQSPEPHFYIQFATETLVRDKCLFSDTVVQGSINLVGENADAVFQEGDFLILQNNNEQFRQQTIP